MRIPASNRRFLFIRILEACNANCYMCAFAGSRDPYRLTRKEFETILPQARAMGVGVVRFTGGEPLLHNDLRSLIRSGADAGMDISVITNGYLLPKTIDCLSEAGLTQIIVSIDGASANTHDSWRKVPGLFEKCIAGLESARDHGVLTRVNTVVGPHNYTELPRLQKMLTGIGVKQWEVSAIKLERRVVYSDPDHVRTICNPIYEANPQSMLVPIGKRFYGDTSAEQDLYFMTGVAPRPSPPQCNLVGNVIFIDAKAGIGFGCNMLPHRAAEESGGGVRMRTESGWTLDSDGFKEHVWWFRSNGPARCRSCSPTAAAYSDDIAQARNLMPWHF